MPVRPNARNPYEANLSKNTMREKCVTFKAAKKKMRQHFHAARRGSQSAYKAGQ
jgi:hypothetical protein